MQNEYTKLLQKIQTIDPFSFEEVALSVFFYQAKHNSLYSRYLQILKKNISSVKNTDDIPFLPISLFKNYSIQTETWQPQEVFMSSGTTSQKMSQKTDNKTSSHYLRDRDFYIQNALRSFESFYGKIENYCVLALLPSYLERNSSSLVFMANAFIERSMFAESGFFLNNLSELSLVLNKCVQQNRPVLLLGVSFALLDLAEQFPQNLQNVIVMETGGMKGRRAEITRPELHKTLSTAFQIPFIHSEYGMTELISQAYSRGEGVFFPAPTMMLKIRDITDPFTFLPNKKTGGINIIDLANLATCAFIATDDLGRTYEDNSFEVIGRLDNSDVRGCNLMI